MHVSRPTAGVLFLLMLPLALMPTLAQDEFPYFETDNCPFELPAPEAEGETYECGYLVVPEDRSDPDSPTVELAVAIIYSVSNIPEADPLVYLAGGPGSGALLEADLWAASPLRADRDIILLDQRGTGFSYPNLNCVELEDEDAEDVIAASIACRDRLLEARVDLSAYNSAASAADIEDLRLALEIDKWNVYGVSYGTRLALTLMRDFPDGIRSVVLDSVYPPHVNAYEEQPLNTFLALEVLFQGCAASITCNEAYPQLGQVFYDVVDQLNATPFDDGEHGLIFGDDVSATIIQSMYSTEVIPGLPLAIYLLAADEFEIGMTLLNGEIPPDEIVSLLSDDSGDNRSDDSGEDDGGDEGLIVDEDLLDELGDISDAEGLYNSVECHDEVPFADRRVAADLARDIPASIRASELASVDELIETCALWGAGTADARENEPVVSNIPTLVLAGEYDPVTPPSWAQRAAEHLSQGYYYEFPGVGHSVIDAGDCPVAMITGFLDDPTSAPDSRCLERMSGPEFAVLEA